MRDTYTRWHAQICVQPSGFSFCCGLQGFLQFCEELWILLTAKEYRLKHPQALRYPSTDGESHRVEKGEKAIFTVRPENVIVLDKEEPGCLKGKVMNVTYKGNMTRIDVEGIFDEVFHVSSYDYDGPSAGEEIYLSIPESKVIIYKK